MFGRKRYPGLRGILREMTAENRYSDAGTEPKTASETAGTDGTLRSPEDIDRELAAEEAEALSEDRVVDPIEEGSERAEAELAEAKEIHRDMIAGCIALSALLLVGAVWARPAWRYAAGVAIGCGVAIYFLIHLYRSVGWELTMEPQQAERYAKSRTAIRYGIVLLAAVAVMLTLGKAAGIGCLLAIVTIKPAAYLQPLTAKIRRKKGR